MGLYLTLRERLLDGIRQGMDVDDGHLQGIVLEQPREISHGDLSTNAAMVLARGMGKSPRDIAERLMEMMGGWEEVSSVEVAGPGFVNLKLQPEAIWKDVVAIDAAVSFAAESPYLGQDIPTIVEYVSINPTGPIHVGHGRNAVFGDVTANILVKAGRRVYREYLMNDAGGQIRVLVLSLHARYRQCFGEDVAVPEDGYPGEYLVDIAQKLKERDGDKWLEVRDEEVLLRELRAFAVESCMDLIRTDLQKMNIVFDRYFSEYEMHRNSDVMQEAVGKLRDKGFVYEGILPPPKGKEIENYEPVELTLFRATAFGLAEDQPVYKRNGEPTYFGQDIGYHWDKWKRGFRKMVTVIGVDQSGSYLPLTKALEALTGEKELYHPLTYEMVKVLRDGEVVRMSKRAGNFILLKDVLDEVGKDVFRFMMLTVKPTTPLTFDLARAAEKTMENPVFYVQYAHARLARLLAQESVREGALDADVRLLDTHGLDLAKTLMMYPLVLEQVVRLLEPHRLAQYARDVATAFHRWYAEVKILDDADAAGTQTRLVLARRAQWVLADLLGICGVGAPESM